MRTARTRALDKRAAQLNKHSPTPKIHLGNNQRSCGIAQIVRAQRFSKDGDGNQAEKHEHCTEREYFLRCAYVERVSVLICDLRFHQNTVDFHGYATHHSAKQTCCATLMYLARTFAALINCRKKNFEIF